MATPRNSKNHHSKKRSTGDILIRFLAFLLVSTLFIILGPTRSMLDQHHALQQTNNQIPGPAINSNNINYAVEVDVAELEHEDAFRATLTHCLPSENSQKCKQFVLPDQTKKRVAIISPPGDIFNAWTKRIQAMAHDEMEVMAHIHVPPYGYGKTHGLSQVIRFIPEPLILQVTDALQGLLEHGETHAIITLPDLKAGLRQILRFHCRISHLSAHTALLSVDTTSTNDEELLSTLQSFLNVTKPSEWSADMFDDDVDELLQVHATDGTQTLTHVQAVSRVKDVMAILDQVLLDELKLSKNMTIWPCPSFWSSGDAPDDTNISPLLQRLAQALSPDCDDPHAKCWVERDKCEAAGDAKCVKKKR